MTVDLLSVRLKEAKRELTALKTAHKRGLGLLRVYNYFYRFADYGIVDDYLGAVKITINSSSDFPPFPLISIRPQLIGTSALGKSLQEESLNYSNSGYSLIYNGYAVRNDSGGLTGFTILSTAPINSLSLEEA